MSYAITTDNLVKTYGNKTVIDNVSIQVLKGSITGLVGKNGAGKTTLMRILSGLVKSNSGTYCVSDASNMSAIIETASLHLSMTCKNNLLIQAKLLALNITEQDIDSLLELVELKNSKNQKANTLSLGMKQRLAIAMCLIGKPSLILMDEPTNGLDPQGIKEMRDLFVAINQKMNITILISSHILSELSKFATHYIFMDQGAVIKCIEADKLSTLTQSVTRIVVDNIDLAIGVLKDNGYNGSATTNYIDITTKVEFSQLIMLLAQNDIKVHSISTVGDNLEDFYLTLMEGHHNG